MPQKTRNYLSRGLGGVRGILAISLALLTSCSNTLAFEMLTSREDSEAARLVDIDSHTAKKALQDHWADEEIVTMDHFTFTEGDLESHPLSQRGLGASSPRHLGVDRLCTLTNTVNNTCTITEKSLRFNSNLYYETDLSIVLDKSRLKCYSVNYEPCILQFKFTTPGSFLELKNSSSIVGKQIIIEAPESEIRILEDSSLWASGQANNVNGTMSRGLGANFLGQGGYCGNKLSDEDYRTYGAFDMVPELKNSKAMHHIGAQMGSIGKANDVETAGGGRIVLIADSVTLRGQGDKIQANARPYADFERKDYNLQGGSGGYVYVKTSNMNNTNSVDKEAKITAKGGIGVGKTGGGSGGVIVFDDAFEIPAEQVDASGGKSDHETDDGCANGAAGTIWYKPKDFLLVDNQFLASSKKTVIRVPKISSFHEGTNYVLADRLTIQKSGRVLMHGWHTRVQFDDLFMYDNSWLQLGNTDKHMKLHLMKNAHISASSTLDFSGTKWVAIYPDEECSITTLGNILYKELIGLKGRQLNLVGAIKTGDQSDEKTRHNSKIVVDAEQIIMYPEAHLESGFTLLVGNKTVEMQDGAKMTSLKQNQCHDDKKHPKPVFSCFNRQTVDAKLTPQSILDEFTAYTNIEVKGFNETLPILSFQYSQYVIAMEDLQMKGSTVEGTRIGICARDATIQDSLLDTSTHGCLSDEGIGKGQVMDRCAGSGGSHAGRGGYGGLEDKRGSIETCKSRYNPTYVFGDEAAFEGSGGASGAKGKRLGGSGGGIIKLNVLQTTKVYNSKLLANGQTGTPSNGVGSGGGAGGTIHLLTTNLKGYGTVEAKGGDGSMGGGGGGAGGRLIVHFLKSFSKSAQPEQSHYWRGQYSLDGGQKGENTLETGTSGNGGIVTSGKCFGGYSGPFCEPCQEGTFKYDYSYAICKACENKPANAFYSGIAQASSDCAYECASGLDPVSVNPHCKNDLELQADRLGGAFSTLAVFCGFLALVLLIWIVLVAQSRSLLKKIGDFNNRVYDGILFSDNEFDASESLPGRRSLRMNDSDIWSHTHRMYLIGENSVCFPWYIPKDFPARALDPANKDKLLRFIRQKQSCLDWTDLQKDTYILFRLLYAPIANLIHRCFRKKHFDGLQDEIYENFDVSFWDERSSRTLRLSSSTTDNQLAYIDFLNYEKSKSEYVGPQLPLTLLLAGSGTFNSPFYLNFEDDALAKSIVYFHKQTLKTKLPLFFENLNTLLAKLSFYKATRSAMKDLAEVIEWIEMGNRTLFNPLDVKQTLYLFENSYQETDGGSFKQRRRSFPMDSAVLEAFPELFKSLCKFIQTKQLGKKSEIRLGLVFKPFSPEKYRKLMDKIKAVLLKQRNGGDRLAGNNFDQSSIPLIFGDDDDADDVPLPVVQSAGDTVTKNLGTIRRGLGGNESHAMITESTMQESEVYIYGGESKQVKILDKSKRAFDISQDSTKSLEMSLHKPRNSCKYKWQRFKAFWYSLFLLALKHHGMPPSRNGLNFYFLAFSLTASFDLILTVCYVYHIFKPMENFATLGTTFLLIYPLATILGPLLTICGALFASPKLLKSASSLNATAALTNLPLTIAAQLIGRNEPFYVALVVFLWVNKVTISYFGAKVRQHLLNPGFAKNTEKMEERFRTLISAKADMLGGVKTGMSAEERASSFVNSGPPDLDAIAKKAGMAGKRRMSSEDNLDCSDEEDETSFGIIGKKNLNKSGESGEESTLITQVTSEETESSEPISQF